MATKDGKQIVRFDVELDDKEMHRLEEVCKKCHRTRKNFSEALIMIVLQSEGTTIDLTKLGVIR